jgi:hypothetical protein
VEKLSAQAQEVGAVVEQHWMQLGDEVGELNSMMWEQYAVQLGGAKDGSWLLLLLTSIGEESCKKTIKNKYNKGCILNFSYDDYYMSYIRIYFKKIKI